MKKQRIYGWTLFFVILIWFPAYSVRADGGYFSRRAVALSADQRAIIIKNGNRISMTFSTGYTGEGEDFGWIIPTPVPPTIGDVSEAGEEGEEAFQILDQYTAPTITESEAGGCFTAGTEVLTGDGPRAIEMVNAGIEVYGCDLTTGKWILQRVRKLQTLRYQGDIIAIEIGQSTIRATGNHPFYVLSGDRPDRRPWPGDVSKQKRRIPGAGRWVEARDLEEGDLLQSRGGGGLRITGVAGRRESSVVYNLEVEGYPNYAVHRRGILVHNKGKQEATLGESPTIMVTVYGTVTLEHYEVSILRAADPSALLQWLRRNDYQIDPAARKVLDTYIEQDWAFVAVKLNPAERRHYENEFLPPLTIRFRHNELVFPMRISSVSTTGAVKIALYMIAESTVHSLNFPTVVLRYDSEITTGVNPEKYIEACIRKTLQAEQVPGLVVMWGQRFLDKSGEVVRWGGGIDREQAQRLRETLDRLMKTPWPDSQGWYLTRLETRLNPASMSHDIELALDVEPRRFRVNLHANRGYDAPDISKDSELIAASQVGEKEDVGGRWRPQRDREDPVGSRGRCECQVCRRPYGTWDGEKTWSCCCGRPSRAGWCKGVARN